MAALTEPVSALVLAGGESRRMGTDKRGVVVAGRPMLRSALELAASVADDVVVCCRREDPPDPALLGRCGARVTYDLRPGGPLAGIEAGLGVVRHESVLVLAVDMPHLTPEFLCRLVEAVRAHPQANGAMFDIPPAPPGFPLLLRRRARPIVADGLDRGDRRIAHLIRRLELLPIGVGSAERAAFGNVNSPGDLVADLALARRAPGAA